MDPVALLHRAAPEFNLPDLGGSAHAVKEVRGRVIVLCFWSAVCPWVARADEALANLAPQWGGRVGVWRVASNADESPGALRAAAEARGLPIVLRDEGQRVADLYGVQVTPHFFVLDGQGVIRYSGALDDVTFRQKLPSRAFLAEAVEAVLTDRRPDPAATPAYGCALVRHPRSP